MKMIRLLFKTLGAGTILVGSFLGTLTFLQYDAGQNETKPSPQTPTTSATLAIDPSSLRECDGPKVAKITWKVASADVQSVKIFVRDKNGKDVFFTSGSSFGMASTAPWVVAGTTFVLKDGYSLKDIIATSVSADKC